MRSVLPGDLTAAARALLPVPPKRRSSMARCLIREAAAADAYCREHRRAHRLWGNGTLMAAAHGHPMGNEMSFDDPDYIKCQIHVLNALLAHVQAEAQDTQRITVGSSSRRFGAISSPQSSQ